MQHDALFATQTPREALEFSAALRLPKSVSKEDRTKMVNRLLRQLHLEKCADTRIGNDLLKGISGGEKKRTAIGVELISRPKILYLDEPTSGLDTYAAFLVVSILKKLARNGTTVISTIHQPSSETFNLFDSVCILAATPSGGRVMYQSTVRNMVSYFANLGYKCEPNVNPADFALFLMQSEDTKSAKKNESLNERLENLASAWNRHLQVWLSRGGRTKAPRKRSSIFLRDLEAVEAKTPEERKSITIATPLPMHPRALVSAAIEDLLPVDDENIPMDEKMRMLSSELLDQDSRLEAIDRMLDMCHAPDLHNMLHTADQEGKKKYNSNTRHARAKYKAKKFAVARIDSTNVVVVDGPRPGTCTQLMWLTVREARNVWRDTGAISARVLMTLFLATLMGLMFKDVGKWSPEDLSDGLRMSEKLSNHFGAVTLISSALMMATTQPVLLYFPLERPVFLREHATRVYAAWPYFFSKLIVEIPLALIQCGVTYAIVHPLIGLQGDIVYLTLVTALLGLVAASTALLIGASVPTVTVALQCAPLLFLPQMMYAGLFISIAKIPSYLRWAQQLCALKYGINLVMLSEFIVIPESIRGEEYAAERETYNMAIFGHQNQSSASCDIYPTYDELPEPDPLAPPTFQITQERCMSALFPRSLVSEDDEMYYVLILLAVFALFRISACLALKYRAVA